MNENTTKIPNHEKMLLELIFSGLQKRSDEVESYAIGISRLIRKENPRLAKSIIDVLSSYSLKPSTRSHSPLPIESDSKLEMVSIENTNDQLPPILNQRIAETISGFLYEREKISHLLEKGIKPSTSILLVGKPGTGKTMLAKYIAGVLKKDLVVLDLASSMSSLLGKTGQNLKKVLEYAKQNSSVLLLDEFDAIAKRRDDSTDLGEIKRVVNVLLMELENWPTSSVLIATSNHPELLDRAIWRRFDHVIEIELPEEKERATILINELSEFLDEETKAFIHPLAKILDNKSPSDLCRFADNAKRRVVLKNENVINALVNSLELHTQEKDIRGQFCSIAKQMLGNEITVRQLAQLTGFSPAGVQYHLTK